ncbi:hypothetical protein KAI87_16250 [Myxococcota bacterium]|nr:hypothetical protein [Myxococcota bacterium]
MKKHGPSELRLFLQRLDKNLESSADVLIIGGAAAAIAYGSRLSTMDIDLWSPLSPQILQALKKISTEGGLVIPVEHAAVADAPYELEARIKEIPLEGLRNLRIFVPDPYDLVLSKMIRGYEHDLQAVEEIHRNISLESAILTKRFTEEMGHIIGDPRRIQLNFLAMMARLFGEEEARRLEELFKENAP